MVRPGNQSGDVGRDARGRGEEPLELAVANILRLRSRLVADNLPFLRCGNHELEGRLQVWLLEYGKHTAAVWHLKLGVKVDVAIGRVHKAVQALTGIHVLGVRLNNQVVLGLKVRQGDAHTVRKLGRV